MILYKEALTILKNTAEGIDIGEEFISLEESIGRILAKDLKARESNPNFDNSAMDGFALNAQQVNEWYDRGHTEVNVVGQIAAGPGSDVPMDGGALEIMTGAPIPSKYFDCVIRIEDVDVLDKDNGQRTISLLKRPSLGDNVRRAGEDCIEGQVLLRAGTQIKNHHLLALACQGIFRVCVRKPVKVGIVSTGKELADITTPVLQFGQIRNSTGLYLESSVKHANCEALNFGIVDDQPNLYVKKLYEAFEVGVDLVVTTGAVSMGVYDFVARELNNMNATIHFHKCAIRPGKPILFATIEYQSKKRFILALPGNPVATAVGMNFFVVPLLRQLSAFTQQSGLYPEPVLARLLNEVNKPEGLRCFFKAILSLNKGELVVEILKNQSSSMVTSLLEANVWAIVPESGDKVEQGSVLEVFQI